jgi:hypothetical protein
MRMKLFALAVLVAFTGIAVAADAPPALPDYTKEPFKAYQTSPYTLEDYPEWGVVTVTLYATAQVEAPGEQAVFVATDKDGKLKMADWLAIGKDNSQTTRRYLYTDGAWKYESTKKKL